MGSAGGDYNQMLQDVRAAFDSGKTRTYEWRASQLKALIKMIEENRSLLNEAVYKDLRKHALESQIFEVDLSLNETIDALNELKEWMKPQKVKKTLIYMMDNAYIKPEPYGVALIMGAWNYPIQLVLSPLIGAIAAGNCVIIKPSELSEVTAKLFGDLVPKYFDNDCIKVVNGGIPETTALLEEKFDLILYTGSSMVGKIVMTAAAKHLTPVILELGGKSPVYIDRDTDLETAARRVCWGKFANVGQTCIAPDYVMISKDLQEKFVQNVEKCVKEFFGDDPRKSESYGRIVNARHFQRVQKLKQGGPTIALEGKDIEEERYIAPTILTDVKLSHPVMQEEIFGPILPIVNVQDHDEAIKIINGRDKPLALYVFSNRKDVINAFTNRTSSGAVLANDAIVHAGMGTLPFGGVGNSGMGAYHGKFTFESFSHMKPVLEKSIGMESVNQLRYPPYNDKKLGWLKWMTAKKVKKTGVMSFIPFMILGTILAFMFKTPGVMAASLPWNGNNQK